MPKFCEFYKLKIEISAIAFRRRRYRCTDNQITKMNSDSEFEYYYISVREKSRMDYVIDQFRHVLTT